MRKTSLVAIVGVVGLVVPGAAAVVTAAVPEQAPRAVPAKVSSTQAAVILTPSSVTVTKDGLGASVRVQYQCTNSKYHKHYLSGTLQQGWDNDAVVYGLGWRNDIGGIRAATCTGGLVTQTLRYHASSWTQAQGKSLAAGPARFRFAVSRHNAQGSGWYTVHSTAAVDRSVTVKR